MNDKKTIPVSFLYLTVAHTTAANPRFVALYNALRTLHKCMNKCKNIGRALLDQAKDPASPALATKCQFIRLAFPAASLHWANRNKASGSRRFCFYSLSPPSPPPFCKCLQTFSQTGEVQ